MHARIASICAELLELDEAEVEELHEDAELLPALLAAVGLALRQRRQRDRGATWADAMRRGWGERPFAAAELIAWAEQSATAPQCEVLKASRELCKLQPEAALTAHRLSGALRALRPSRVEVVGSVRDSHLWALRDRRE